MDKLEKFIKDNRAEFDQNKPDLNWDDVENKLENNDQKENNGTVRVKKWWLYAGVAASVAIVIGAFVVAGSGGHNTHESVEEIAAGNEGNVIEEPVKQAVGLADISEDYAEIEAYYVVQVKNKVTELKSLDPDPEFLEDINALEEEYESLKKELGAGGDDEIIIEAMIENYRLKLEILEDILMDLKSTNNTEDYDVEI